MRRYVKSLPWISPIKKGKCFYLCTIAGVYVAGKRPTCPIQTRRVSFANRVVPNIAIPIRTLSNRVLRDKPAGAAVVVAMPHQDKPRVRVTLAPVLPAIPEPRRVAAPNAVPRAKPEARRVLVERLLPASVVLEPQVPQQVIRPVAAHAPTVLRQPRRERRVAVIQNGRTRRSAVADVGVAAGAVGLAHPQTQAVVGERVSVALRLGCI